MKILIILLLVLNTSAYALKNAKTNTVPTKCPDIPKIDLATACGTGSENICECVHAFCDAGYGQDADVFKKITYSPDCSTSWQSAQRKVMEYCRKKNMEIENSAISEYSKSTRSASYSEQDQTGSYDSFKVKYAQKLCPATNK